MTLYILGAEALQRKLEVDSKNELAEAGYLHTHICFPLLVEAMVEVKANVKGFTFVKNKASYPK